MQIQPYRGFLCVSGDHSHAKSEFRIAMNTDDTVPPHSSLCLKYALNTELHRTISHISLQKSDRFSYR